MIKNTNEVILPQNLYIGFNTKEPMIIVATKEVDVPSMALRIYGKPSVNRNSFGNGKFIVLTLTKPVKMPLASFMKRFTDVANNKALFDFYSNVISDIGDQKTGMLKPILSGKPLIAAI